MNHVPSLPDPSSEAAAKKIHIHYNKYLGYSKLHGIL